MAKFTRTDGSSHASWPGRESRVYGEQVTVGEPLQIRGDAELRADIENSLEMLAKQRLLEAETQAEALVTQAQAETARLMAEAEAQAQAMLEAARAETDGIREAAHEEGFKAGFQEGYADATEQVQQEAVEMLRGAQVLAENAYQAERRVLKDFEAHALAIVRHVIRRILGRELADSPETLLGVIDQAVESLYLSGKVRVVVSAQIIQDLRQFSEGTRAGLDAMRRYEFVADPALDPHQIYIIGQDGSFDVSPETQADALLAPLEKHLQLSRPGDSTEWAEPAARSEVRDAPGGEIASQASPGSGVEQAGPGIEEEPEEPWTPPGYESHGGDHPS